MLPTGVIPISIPNKKIANPTIIRKDPITNFINDVPPMGVSVKFRIMTIIVMGKIENVVSFNFDLITFNNFHSPFFTIKIIFI